MQQSQEEEDFWFSRYVLLFDKSNPVAIGGSNKTNRFF